MQKRKYPNLDIMNPDHNQVIRTFDLICHKNPDPHLKHCKIRITLVILAYPDYYMDLHRKSCLIWIPVRKFVGSGSL